MTARPRPLRAVPEPDHVPADPFDLAQPMPHDLGAEQTVLGAVMLAPRVLGPVRDLIGADDFYRPAHGLIWDTITRLADNGAPCDVLAVAAALGKDLGRVGGGPYLHDLTAKVVVAEQAGYYARIVRQHTYARHVVQVGHRLAQLGQHHDDPGGLRGAVLTELGTLTAADLRGWADPIPLSSTPDLPTFPLWALPDWIGEYAARVAEATQTPADLAGSLVLAVLALAAGGKVWAQAPTWKEPLNLYLVVILPPGSRKSEVYSLMVKPVRTAEKQLQEAAAPKIAERRIAYRIAEAQADRTAKIAENAADDFDRMAAVAEAEAAALELEKMRVPAEPKLYSSNATVEKITSLLAEQGGRFAVLAPEGKIFSILAGQYSGTPDLEVFLSGHAGEEMRVDRRGRPSEVIESATLTMGVCVQPGVLARLGDTPQFREQGLLGRLMFAMPESLLGYRNARPEPVPQDTADAYAATLGALILSLDALTEPAHLTLAADTTEAVYRLLADTEQRFRPGGDLAHMTDWGGKYVGATLRIAGLLHLAQHLKTGWERPIDLATFEAAIEISGYYATHAQAAYDAIGADPATNNARALLETLRTTRRASFTARDILASNRRFKRTEDVEAAARVLENHGWIRRLPDPPKTGRGRAPAAAWETHPNLPEQSPTVT